MKFYEVYRDSCGEFSIIEYYLHKKNAEARAKELNDKVDECDKQYDFYGVLEDEFEDAAELDKFCKHQNETASEQAKRRAKIAWIAREIKNFDDGRLNRIVILVKQIKE